MNRLFPVIALMQRRIGYKFCPQNKRGTTRRGFVMELTGTRPLTTLSTRFAASVIQCGLWEFHAVHKLSHARYGGRNTEHRE